MFILLVIQQFGQVAFSILEIFFSLLNPSLYIADITLVVPLLLDGDFNRVELLSQGSQLSLMILFFLYQ